MKGERTWKGSSKIRDSRVATRREESFVESDMFGDDGLAALWEPDEETGLAVLVASADVDAGFTAGGELALFLKGLVM